MEGPRHGLPAGTGGSQTAVAADGAAARRVRSGRRRGRWAVAAGLVVALLALTACGGGAGGGQGAGGSSGDTVKIGIVLPQTGREAKPGTYQLEGVQLAIEQINAAGGIEVGGKQLKIEPVIYDDESDQAKSASLVQRAMEQDKVVAVIGGYSTALGQAQSPMADRYQVPWITPGAAASSIFSQGYQYTFGTLAPVSLLGYTTGEFLGWLVDQGKLQKGLRIALVVENTDHGVDYANGIKQWIQDHPGYFEIVVEDTFELGGTDFSGVLQKVKNANADIFLSDAHLEDYITMHRQYTQMGLRHQMISYGARGPEEAAREALGDAVDYIFAGIWWSKALPYPQVKKFVEDYKVKYGREPDSWYAATAYDAMRILAKAIDQADSLDPTAIRDALREVELTDSLLPGQRLKFPENGQVQLPFVIVQNKPGGQVDIVYPEDAATGEAVAPIPAQ
ncbi:Extracellular ligand-binding receptor [Thermaerobacter marianensis DSM 12885]|uniref:Extracellular ligand-binding receptor n=1 Tax=Thermaerobacter marianensis (strain ATCC 700841 / DSM 12885 / JCM 10246 / 7p75a) TaxID=644966 RepID=E6SH09_THEM7|nr:amino acid ABC transporter substrate-binding protein [Thermaerobacter marianensis]ADU50640.1 Extracellular ligand-binding receptor [Thermaerobacter marianensis DSM 12885]